MKSIAEICREEDRRHQREMWLRPLPPVRRRRFPWRAALGCLAFGTAIGIAAVVWLATAPDLDAQRARAERSAATSPM